MISDNSNNNQPFFIFIIFLAFFIIIIIIIIIITTILLLLLPLQRRTCVRRAGTSAVTGSVRARRADTPATVTTDTACTPTGTSA